MVTDWKQTLRDQLERLVDSLVVDGVSHKEIFNAIVSEVRNLETAYDKGPDPQDDRPGTEAEEPSNEWPGAVP